MRIEPFVMERMQSIWEHQVRYNLSESGVHAMTLDELADPAELRGLRLGYIQTNGSIPLRQAIAGLYSGASEEQVLVTNGTAEANFITVWSLAEPDAEIVVMLPNYMQIWGVTRAFCPVVKSFPMALRRDRWAPDLDRLESEVTNRTRLICLCNPNNPTGGVLSDDEIDAVCRIASKVGAWVLADEVYRGAELDGRTTTSFWGRYDRVLVVCGFSKAYGLPGLRIGWVAGPADKIAELWSYKDYTSIAPSSVSDWLGRAVLEPSRHARILERTRRILREQYPIVGDWLLAQRGVFSFVPPRAGAIVYARYDMDINSTALVDRLREQKSVLIVPGDQFGMDRFVRLGYGGDRHELEQGLSLFAEFIGSLAGGASAR